MVTDNKEIQFRRRMRDDFPFYAERNLKIAHKNPQVGIVPFKLNRAQKFIHEKLQEQLKETGKVRALVLKARQQGCSTLAEGRFYHRVTHMKAVNAYVLSHAMDTTEKLFVITRRYHEKGLKEFTPNTRAASAKELAFSNLDSTFYIGTAGAKQTGRGGTVHFFHGSEVAFWPSAESHFAGVMQSIPDGKFSTGTEIILESTANGPTGKFYELCMDAQKGKGEYQLIFTPWYWQDDYRTTPPVGWDWTKQDDYEMNRIPAERYGLDMEQIYWMHLKRIQLTWDWRFKQEYPTTVEEAFQVPGDTSLIPINVIEDAILHKDNIRFMHDQPRIAALDPAGASRSADRTGIGHRCGRIFEHIEYHKGKTQPELLRYAKEYIDKWNIDRMFVDTQGLGLGVYEHLVEDGYKKVVRPCNFSTSSEDRDPNGNKLYERKRDECWGRMHKWFLDAPVEIPNLQELRNDLTAPGYDRSSGKLKLESKKDMRTRGIKSPDGGDVLAMTFTEKVSSRLRKQKQRDTVVTKYNELNHGLYN